MMELFNVKENDPRKETAERIIEGVLSCGDAAYVDEIYAKEGSFDEKGFISNWMGLMVVVPPEFDNKSLFGILSDIEEGCADFHLVISVEPNAAGRGSGTVLWKRGV